MGSHCARWVSFVVSPKWGILKPNDVFIDLAQTS